MSQVNVNLEMDKHDDVDESEREHFELARRRKTNARSAVTKEINAFYKLMRKDENFERIVASRQEIDSKCDELKDAFGQYIAIVDSAKKVEEENARQEQILQDISDFYEELDTWIKETKETSTKHSVKSEDDKLDVLVQRVVNEVSKKLSLMEDDVTGMQRTKPEKPTVTTASSATIQSKMNDNTTQLSVTAPNFQPAATTSFTSSTAPQQSSTWSTPVYQQPIAVFSHLPPIEMAKFSGDSIEFNNFMRAFQIRVVAHTHTDSDRLCYLHQSLEGEPKELISGCLYMDDQSGFEEALRLLKEHYGRSTIVANSFLNKLQKVKPIRADDVEGLKQLYLLVNKCLCAMNSVHDLAVLDFPINLQMIIVKLPLYIQNKWRDIVSRKKGCVQFADLVTLLRSSSDAANNPFFGKEALDAFSRASLGTRQGEAKSSKVNTFATTSKADSTTVASDNTLNRPRCRFCDKEGHYLNDCRKFGSQSFETRREFVRSKRLCFSCLGANHIAKECKRRKSCSICSKNHPTSLHINREERSNATEVAPVVQESSATIQFASKTDDRVMHSILPVKVSIGDKTVVTYAFYDNGSSASFISERLKQQLNVRDCPSVALKLVTMHGSSVIESALVKDVTVQGYDGENSVQIKKVYVKDAIPVSSSNIPRKEFLAKHSKLKKFADLVPEFLEDVDIGLLIGCNCPKALEPLRVMASTDGPFACQLRHGWVVNGPMQPGRNHNASCHRVMIDNVQVQELPVPDVLSLKNQEADFRFGSERVPDERGWSQEDKLNMEDRRRRRKTSEESNSEGSDGEEDAPVVAEKKEEKVSESAPCGDTAATVIENDSMDDECEYETESYDEDETTEAGTELTEDEHGELAEEEEVLEGQQEWLEEKQPAAETENVDDDEDRKNPAYIPWRGAFYEHDNCLREEEEGGERQEAEPEEVDEAGNAVKSSKKQLWTESRKWDHDRYTEDHRYLSDDQVVCVSSLNKAENVIVRRVQMKNFSKEMKALKESKPVGAQSPLHRLDPFCENGILRVGGRLKNAISPDITKHQVLLPRKGHVTTVIIRSYHESLQHAGRNHVLSAVRERYWIVHGNAAVRSVVWHCVVCRKLKGAVIDQKMANLPAGRMSVEPPFTHTGVDLFGPFHVKNGRKECKRYGVIFTCLSCRAIHLEVAHSLEKDAFINALRRFIARRGKVKAIYCDNGTNLVGTERELHRAVYEHDESVRRCLLRQEIEWKFNPPEGSHMGGAWERLIRSVRSVLNPLMREFGSRLNDETLTTMLCEAEAIVNSRPLTCISDSTDDLKPLAPNHLLTLKDEGGSSPAGIFQREDVYSRKRWRQVQYLSNLFWSRWKREFLAMQQIRQKWTTKKRNLRVGDVIIVKDDDSPRSSWPLARITEVKVGTDDLVRSVTLRKASSVLRRPASKCIVLLPVEEQ